jgi:hypothetical protein
MSHKLNSAVAEIGVEIGKDSFDFAFQPLSSPLPIF